MPVPIHQRTDCAYIELTWQQWASYPQAVRDAFQLFGREYPQGMGKPVVIEIPSYRLPELLDVARANGMETAE